MTHAWKERESQYTETPSIWLWGKYVAPVVLDLADTLAQCSQTVLPAFKAFGYMILMVIKTFFFSWLEDLGHFSAKYQQNLKDTAEAGKQGSQKPSRRLPNGLSIESAMSLRKIQGAIGENWSAGASSSVRLHQGKENRWADASRTQSDKTVSPIQQDVPRRPKVNANKSVSTKAPIVEEEIRGLDDIFDRPVTGFFLDSEKSAPVRPSQKKAGATHQRKLPDYQLAEPKVETKKQTLYAEGAEFDMAEAEACNCQRPKAKIGAVEPAMSLAQATATPISMGELASANYLEVETDWYSMTEAEAYSYDAIFDADYADLANIQLDFEDEDTENELITGGSTGLKLVSSLPEAAYSLPGEEVTSTETQAPPQSVENVEVFPQPAAPVENVEATPVEQPVEKSFLTLPPQPIQKAIPWFAQQTVEQAEPAKPSSLKEVFSSIPWFLQDSQPTAPVAPAVASSESKAEPVKPLAAPQKPTTPSVQAMPAHVPLSLDHELEEDLSSCNYMAQSNRMLSNSISNLVESYFRKAAEEEQPDFY